MFFLEKKSGNIVILWKIIKLMLCISVGEKSIVMVYQELNGTAILFLDFVVLVKRFQIDNFS